MAFAKGKMLGPKFLQKSVQIDFTIPFPERLMLQKQTPPAANPAGGHQYASA